MGLEARVEELRKRFREAIEYIKKGDAVQASEELYKVAENAIKILSEINNIPEHEKAVKEGTWWTKLLDKAAKRLRDIYGEELLDARTTAYKILPKRISRRTTINRRYSGRSL